MSSYLFSLSNIHEQCRPCSTIKIFVPSYLRDKLHIDRQALKTAQDNGVSLIYENPTLEQPTSPDKDRKDAFSASTRNEPVHEISSNVVFATNKASYQPVHTRSVIRAFVSRLSIL